MYPIIPKKEQKMVVNVALDGSCLKNPGGQTGWAWYIDEDNWASGGQPTGTNNIGELLALINFLETCDINTDYHLLFDSQYVMNTWNNWMWGWENRGWTNSTGKEIKNKDLVIRLFDLAQDHFHHITTEWVKGHNGHKLNEKADQLAQDSARLAIESSVARGPGLTTAHI